MEVWKEVIDNKYYMVSSKGRVRSLISNKIIKPYTTKKGYLRIGLYYYEQDIERGLDSRGRKRRTLKRYGSDGKHKNVLVHQLVLSAFVDKPEWANMVNHKDGDKQNNSLDNLEWSNDSKNMKHAYDIGLQPSRSGEKSGHNKLNKEDVCKIRKRVANGESDLEISKDYDVTAANIYRIRKGLIWKNCI